MNGKDLILGLHYVSPELVQQAAFPAVRFSRRKLARAVLIAALIALLLVGCAVVYTLKMRDLSIGSDTLTLTDLKGSPGFDASWEWFQYLELHADDADSQEMNDALLDILKKHDLSPEGESLKFSSTEAMCSALGIEKIQTAQNDVRLWIRRGECRSSGNFRLFIDLEIPADDAHPLARTWGWLSWNRTDCFSPEFISIHSADDWREWNYTTASGSAVLIFRSASDWRGWIVCPREDALMSMQVCLDEPLSDGQLERIADAIDFSITPNLVTQAPAETPPAVLPSGFSIELKEIKTDGLVAHLIFSLTAPEGTDLPGNIVSGISRFFPASGRVIGGSESRSTHEDSDGFSNTKVLHVSYEAEMEDGSAPFAPGSVWTFHMEDLVSSEVWGETLLARGVWDFEITFAEEHGSFESIELLPEPTKFNVIIGWDESGKNFYDDVLIHSIEVHAMSVKFVTDQAGSDPGTVIAVMPNGTQVPLQASLNDNIVVYTTDESVDLRQAEFLMLEGGRQIPIA